MYPRGFGAKLDEVQSKDKTSETRSYKRQRHKATVGKEKLPQQSGDEKQKQNI